MRTIAKLYELIAEVNNELSECYKEFAPLESSKDVQRFLELAKEIEVKQKKINKYIKEIQEAQE